MPLTPFQSAALKEPNGSVLEDPPMLINLSVNNRIPFGPVWQCEISFREVLELPFSQRPDLVTSRWTSDQLHLAVARATVILEGVGAVESTASEMTPTKYILRRRFIEQNQIDVLGKQ